MSMKNIVIYFDSKPKDSFFISSEYEESYRELARRCAQKG